MQRIPSKGFVNLPAREAGKSLMSRGNPTNKLGETKFYRLPHTERGADFSADNFFGNPAINIQPNNLNGT